MEFPPILVINLDERKDRWKEIQSSFSNWNVPLERVSAVRMKPGWKGCSLSHRKCIEIAKERNYPWVLILEDDCLPSSTKQSLSEVLPSLWSRRNEWDIFNGGPSQLFDIKVVTEQIPLYQVKGYATHFILIHQGSYDRLLKEVHENMKIDVFYKDNMRCWASYPHCATQAVSKSDIENTETDYTDSFQKTNQQLFETLTNYRSKLQKTIALVLVGAFFTAYIWKK
jgi:GR25 family glycosyltransferase involved in LPS biosynthesis